MGRTHKCTAVKLTNTILDRETVWVAWKQMPAQERKNWSAIAKAALDNRALQSLIGRSKLTKEGETSGEIAKRIMENVTRSSKSQEQTENMRHILCGVELIRELLEEMVLVNEQPVLTDPNSTF